ncbi:MAG: DUF4418 family protein [Oscillospiraceae bacterium]|jgi:hypothetical protein|nr:DUF4418 family protein [Oscillospiraceae bacterium]
MSISKNRIGIGAVSVISGALTAFGPHTLFKVCSESGHHGIESTAVSVCHYSAAAELGIGILIALLGIAYILFSSPHTHVGLSLGIGLNALLALLIITVLIGVDPNPMMSCRVRTLPALTLISSLTIAVSIGNLIYLLRKTNVKTALAQ